MELEYILSIITIIILVKQNSTFKKQIQKLNSAIDALHKKVETLTATNNTIVEKKVTPAASNDNEVVTKPIVKPKAPKTTEELFNTESKKTQNIPPIISSSSIPKEKYERKETIAAPSRNPKPQAKKVSMKKLSLWERFKKQNPDLEKFVGENLINKIGVLILVLGISYFVKYAIDKDWINEPARVAIGILAGSLVLGIAHKLRKKYASFSSVLVAGAIAIFYFTIAIAFHEYQLFNQSVAFVIMVAITAFSCLLSLSYNRIELAILSLIGGFAVPFMISTGEGDFKVLFSYILILNIGILAIAYFKKWSLVTILSFVFTNLLLISWITSFSFSNKEIPYLGAFIFAFIFYLLFVLTNIINNLRTKGEFTKTQLILLTTNSFVFYGIGMYLLSNFKPELTGLFTTGLALLNLLYASFLYKKFGLDKKAVYLLIGLTLTFITLAIPIQFKGNYITLFWAAEAVLLMWLAQKSKIKSYRFASVLVQILMLISLILDWQGVFRKDVVLTFIINPVFITGIVATISLFTVYYLLRNETIEVDLLNLKFNTVIYKKCLKAIIPIVMYLTGFVEASYQAVLFYGEVAASFSIIAVYHLLFSAVYCFLLWKNKTLLNNKLINIISLTNVLLYVLLIVQLPFEELKENIIKNENMVLAFSLHFATLVLASYFIWILYQTNKNSYTFQLYKKPIVMWIFAGVVVFIASKELIIEGLTIGSPEITAEQLAELQNNYGSNKELGYYDKSYAAEKNINTLTFKIVKTALPVLWGVLSFLFLIIGIKKQVKSLRIIALALLGLTIIKLFTYDISNVSETGKIIAFILLGILILVISFVYQKIKVLVTSEEDSKTDVKTP